MALPNPETRAKVQSRIEAGLCLVCDQAAYKRQLCTKCYQRYRTELLSTPRTKRAQFEARLIRAGYLLESRQGQRLADQSENPFRQIATKE